MPGQSATFYPVSTVLCTLILDNPGYNLPFCQKEKLSYMGNFLTSDPYPGRLGLFGSWGEMSYYMLLSYVRFPLYWEARKTYPRFVTREAMRGMYLSNDFDWARNVSCPSDPREGEGNPLSFQRLFVCPFKWSLDQQQGGNSIEKHFGSNFGLKNGLRFHFILRHV